VEPGIPVGSFRTRFKDRDRNRGLNVNEHFVARADEFIARLRAAPLDAATEVVLVYHCVDQDGHPLPPIRTSLEPTTTVQWPGDPESARKFAASIHLDTIIGNVNALVRNAPEGPIRLRDGPEFAVTVRDFSLEVLGPGDPVRFTIRAEAPPLREDASGALRIGQTRVLLELVIRAFQDGATPETIVQRYSTLTLAEVYAAIGYYLRHRSEVENYLASREQKAEEVRRRIEQQQGDLSDIRSRLLAQRSA
jgi:uncharacterized protein (DUF433 family)